MNTSTIETRDAIVKEAESSTPGRKVWDMMGMDENFYDFASKWDSELTERVYLALTKSFRESLEKTGRDQALAEIKLLEDLFLTMGLNLGHGVPVEKLSEMDSHLFSVMGWEIQIYEKKFKRVTPWEMTPQCPRALPSQVAKVLVERRGTISGRKFGI